MSYTPSKGIENPRMIPQIVEYSELIFCSIFLRDDSRSIVGLAAIQVFAQIHH
jgi:hypothetical protein